jgi:NAD(P)H-dependent flavin oxidoreductase YrpB (nitropropane dioxygenase family)
MIHTGISGLLAVGHPIVLEGMGAAASLKLVAAVSNAGGFRTLCTTALQGAQIVRAPQEIFSSGAVLRFAAHRGVWKGVHYFSV